MDPSRHIPGQWQGQQRGHPGQAPSGHPWATRLPYDSFSFVPDTSFAQPSANGAVSGVHSWSEHANFSDSIFGGGSGPLPPDTSWMPSSSSDGNTLPSLSETRLLTQMPSSLQSRGGSHASHLPDAAMPPGSAGVARAVNQSSTLHPPPNPYSGPRLHTSNASHYSPRFRDSHAYPFSAFNHNFQFPEERWRRTYDRPSPSFQRNAGPYTHASRPPSAAQARRVPDPLRVSSRQVFTTSRRRGSGLSQDPIMDTPPSDLVEKDPVHTSHEALAKIKELQGKIQWAMITSEYCVRKPDPPLDIDAMDEKTCDICYQQFGVATPEGVTEEPIKLPKCGHVFGCACLGTWLKSRSNWSCPMCRTAITPYLDTVYDFDLWKQYIRIRDGLTEQQEIQFLRRVIASKNRSREETEGKLVLEARWPPRRPAPDDEDVDEPPRTRVRFNEPDDFSSDDDVPDPSPPEYHQPDRAVMPPFRPHPPSDPNGGHAEPVRENHDDARYASPPPDDEPSDAVTERSLSDVESVENPGPDMPAPRIRITPTHGDTTRAARMRDGQSQTSSPPQSGRPASTNQ